MIPILLLLLLLSRSQLLSLFPSRLELLLDARKHLLNLHCSVIKRTQIDNIFSESISDNEIVKCQMDRISIDTNVKFQLSNVICQISYFKCHIQNVIFQMSYVKCHISNDNCHLSNVKSVDLVRSQLGCIIIRVCRLG